MSVKSFLKRPVIVLSFIVFVVAFIALSKSGLISRASTALLPVNAGITQNFPAGAGGDVNGDGNADPGDTIEYTITVNNPGAGDATGVVITDVLQNELTLVGTSVKVSPIVTDESFPVTGNVRIQVPDGASDLLANDIDPDTGNNTGLTASGPTTTSQNGNLTINSDGSFSYNPAPGFTGTDTFTYTVTSASGGTSTGTATLNVTGMIWFVNSAAGTGGDGRLTAPFNCFQGVTVSCFSLTAADDPGDSIFLYNGSYTGGYTLLNNQKLIGQGAAPAAAGTLASIAGITLAAYSDALPATNGNPDNVTITSTANGITLGQNNTLRGFKVGATTGSKISGNNFGTLTAGNTTTPDLKLEGAGMALNLTNGTFDASSAFNSVATTSSAGAGINFSQIAGTVAFGGTSVSGATTQGILIGTSTANINFGNTTVSGGTDLISLQNNSAGTRTFGTISTTNGSGVGFLHAVGGGAVSVTGTATFTNPGGRCIDMQNSTTAVAFASVNATQCGGTGVFMDDNTGNVTFAALNISSDANQIGLQATAGNTGTITTTGGTITTTSNTAVDIVGTSTASRTPLAIVLSSVSSTGGVNNILLNNVSGTVTMNGGAISSSSGAAFSATGSTATVLYAGSITNTTNGISLTNNTGGTFTFSGGMNISTGANAAFTATGGGTVSVCATNPCAGGAAVVNTLTTTTGTALNVANTNIGTGGLNFRSINVDGNDSSPVNGIVLNNTGTSGGLTVTGNGSAGTGGIIQDTSGAAVLLNTTDKVSLSFMNITSNISHGLELQNVTGAVSLSTINSNSNQGRGIYYVNTGGTATLNVQNSQFNNNSGANSQGIWIEGNGTANLTATINNSQIQGNASIGIIARTATGTPTMTANLTNSTISSASAADVSFESGAGNFNYTITGNTISNTGSPSTAGPSINLKASNAGKLGPTTGLVQSNTLGTVTNFSSSCSGCASISLNTDNSSSLGASVVGNLIQGIGLNAIQATSRLSSKLQAVVTGNRIVGSAGVNHGPAFFHEAGVANGQSSCLTLTLGGTVTPGSYPSTTANAKNRIEGNFDPTSMGGGGMEFYMQQYTGSTFNLPGLSGGVEAWINSRNEITSVDGLNIFPSGTISNGSSCPGFFANFDENNTPIIDTASNNATGNAADVFYTFRTSYQTPSEMLATLEPLFKHSADAETNSNELIVAASGESVSSEYALKAKAELTEAGNLETVGAFFSEVSDKLSSAVTTTVLAQTDEKVSAPLAGETVTIDGAGAGFTIPSGKSLTVTFKATVNNGPFNAGVNNISNNATVTGSPSVNVTTNTVSLALDAAPDLEVTTTDLGVKTQPSGAVSYTVNYRNITSTKTQNALGVVVTHVVPANTTFNLGASAGGWSCANGAVAGTSCTITVGALNAGGNGTATFAVNLLDALPSDVVQVAPTISIADNGANGTDLNTLDNTGTETTPIVGNWLGDTSSDWFVTSNWSNGEVPPAGNNISIPPAVPTAANRPSIPAAGADVSVGNLVLNGGNLNIAAGRTLTVGGSASLGANIVDGAGTLALGAASSISRSTGQVESVLKKTFGGAEPLFIFPVGTNTNHYSPVNVTVTAGAGDLSVKANAGTAPTTPAINDATTLDRYWTLEGAGITSDITFNYLPADVDGNEAAYHIIRAPSGGGAPVVRYQPNGTTIILDAANNFFTVRNLSSYSNWTAGEPLPPSAASVNIGGRIVNSMGVAVSNARVSIAGADGIVRESRTNPFGYYRLTEIATGASYTVSIRHKQYEFASRVITVTEESENIDFFANP